MNGLCSYAGIGFIVAQYDGADDGSRIEGLTMLISVTIIVIFVTFRVTFCTNLASRKQKGFKGWKHWMDEPEQEI